MSRRLSLDARRSLDDPNSDDFQIVLIEVTHDDMEGPVRLSSDATEFISAEPLTYGTRSAWRGAAPATEYYQYVPMTLELPGDQEDVPTAVRIGFSFFDSSLAAVLRSFATPARAQIALVQAATPDLVEQQFLNLETRTSDFGLDVTVEATRWPIEDEGTPMHLMGPDRFPALFR